MTDKKYINSVTVDNTDYSIHADYAEAALNAEKLDGKPASKYVSLDEGGLIPGSLLPGFVDEIFKINSTEILDSSQVYTDLLTLNNYIIYTRNSDETVTINIAKWNGTGFEKSSRDITSAILIDVNTNIQYRSIHQSSIHSSDFSGLWEGHFAPISSSVALGETASTAYPGNLGAANSARIEEVAGSVQAVSTTVSNLESSVTTSINNINSSLSNYLPISGGLVTGNIKLDYNVALSGRVGRTSTTYYSLLNYNGTYLDIGESNVHTVRLNSIYAPKMIVNGTTKTIASTADITAATSTINNNISNIETHCAELSDRFDNYYTKDKAQSKLNIAKSGYTDNTDDNQIPTTAAVWKMIQDFFAANGGVSGGGSGETPVTPASGDVFLDSYYGEAYVDANVTEGLYGDGEE